MPTTLPPRKTTKKPPVEQFIFDLRDFCRRQEIDPAVAGPGALIFAAMIACKQGDGSGWMKWLRMARNAWKAAKELVDKGDA